MTRSSFWQTPAGTAVISAGTSVVCVAVFLGVLPLARPGMLSLMLGGHTETTSSTLAVPIAASIPDHEDEMTIHVVKRNQPAVVAILVKAPQDSVGRVDFNLEDLFNPEAPVPEETHKSGDLVEVGGGSGFFVSPDGLIVTNKHVVNFEGATFTVVTHDGRELEAKLLATDPLLDVAILKVQGDAFPNLEFADSDMLVPGQTVIAIGNALDEFRNTVTKGVVSGLNRRIIADDGDGSEVLEEAIQTDAAINPGNSGGPLIDLSGAVVGINTAVSERGQSLGFALPSNVIRRIVDSVRRTGRIVRPFLGVRYQIVTKDLVDENQLPVDYGALVIRGDQRNELAVAPGSPADKAGIVENDILLEFGGTRIDESHSLSTLISRHAPGEEVPMVILHAGERKTVNVVLEELNVPTK